MKISNSKKELARIIRENGGWRDGAEFSALEESAGGVWFCKEKPKYKIGLGIFSFNDFMGAIDGGFEFANWHQTILSRAEYFHLHPAPDADGWIEWKGKSKSPVENGVLVDVKLKGGAYHEAELLDDASWSDAWSDESIIAYRLHKPGQAKSTAVGDDETDIAAKEELEAMEYRESPEQRAKLAKIYAPSIELLAADYRNAKEYAERKQQEADAAKADADEKLRVLEIAGEALGLMVSPITAKQEPELVITNRSQLELGDVIWLSDSTVKENNELTPSGEYTVVKVGVIGVESDGQTIYPDFSTREWRFIRRP